MVSRTTVDWENGTFKDSEVDSRCDDAEGSGYTIISEA